MVIVYGECWVNVGVIEKSVLSRYLCKVLCVTICNICISLLEINCRTVKLNKRQQLSEAVFGQKRPTF